MKQFKVPGFLVSSNIYEVNTRQYTAEGTFKAFVEHLPRLKQMGVEILWFMPIHPIGTEKRKGSLGSYYSIKNFREVNSEFGNLEDFKLMVETIHNLGMRIILDWVANHAAWDNNWTLTNPDFFERDEELKFKSPYDWTDVIQINHSNIQEQDAMIDAMSYWITECNIDGFRADLAHLTPLAFWIKARTALDKMKPELVWLAETEEVSYHQAFDISYTWKWMHASEEFVKSDFDVSKLLSLLSSASKDFGSELRMYYTSNHDENSWNGSEYEKYGIYARALAVFANTYIHSVPLIYSGQELPCKKRLSFFDKDQIDWDEQPALHSFYSILLQLRARNPVFNADAVQSFIDNPWGVLAYKIINGDDCVFVVLNISRLGVTEVLNLPGIGGIFNSIFTNELRQLEQRVSLTLAPGEFLVLEKIKP